MAFLDPGMVTTYPVPATANRPAGYRAVWRSEFGRVERTIRGVSDPREAVSEMYASWGVIPPYPSEVEFVRFTRNDRPVWQATLPC